LAILDDPATSATDKIRAATQLGRLSIYLGEMLTPESDDATRYKVFADCWNGFIEKINPTLVGENPAYYYFKGMCFAYWFDVAPLADFFNHKISTLLNLMEKSTEDANAEFEGGSPFRLTAYVYGNRSWWRDDLGLYQPNQALVAINRALASPGMLDTAAEETISGVEFLDNWLGQAKVYMELNDLVNAKNACGNGIARFLGDLAAGTSPASRTIESGWVLGATITQFDALG
jgi:hypothetical protein